MTYADETGLVLCQQYRKPMTIEEAREAFEHFLNEAATGKERAKVRIVFVEKE